MERKNLGLVIGELYHPRMVYVFERLSELFNVSAYVIQRDQILNKIPGCFNTLLFKSEDHTPGYMRGLESHLFEQDLIICVNIGSFSSLQAARTSRENNIPLICYTTDCDLSLFQNYRNIKAIQDLLSEVVELFLVPAQNVANQLLQHGIVEEKIQVLPPRVDTAIFNANEEKRIRFQRYIGLEKSDKVILFYGDLEKSEQPDMVVKALKLQHSLSQSAFSNLKLMFLGQGEYCKELQYLTYKLGLGQQTYFLKQDPEPFLTDLFCAIDLLVIPNSLSRDKLPLFPYSMLEAMACGVIPLVASNGFHADVLAIDDLVFNEHSYESLAFLMHKVLSDENKIDYLKRLVASTVAKLGEQTAANKLFSHLREIADFRANNNQDVEPFWELWEQQSQVEGQTDEVLSCIEEFNLNRMTLNDRSRLLTIKGQALMTARNFDLAQTCFESAIKSNSKNSQAFRGLGYLAWHSYNHEEAIGAFRKGLALSPNDYQCVLGISLVYKRLGMLEDAIFWAEKSILMGAPGKMPFKALVQACCESNAAEYAIASLERVLALVGEHPILMRGLGQLYLKTGHVKIGHQILDKYLTPSLPNKKN